MNGHSSQDEKLNGGFLPSETRLSPRAALALGLLFVTVVGMLDYVTGDQIKVTIFYLIPVVLASWFGPLWTGLAFSLLAVAVSFVLDRLTESKSVSTAIPVWNALMDAGFFAVISLLVSRLKGQFEMESGLARRDPLTSLANGRGFYEAAGLELERARRTGKPLTMAYLDLDHFKPLNDRLGHFVGDAALKEVGRVISSHVRRVDVAARLGGDEFCVLLPEADSGTALEVFKRLHAVLDRVMTANGWAVTFSIGLMTFKTPPATVDVLVRVTDGLMYKVKNAGRNALRHDEWNGEIRP
jgi:diguanylate cyclase (GGDEF)-like protein